MLYDYILTAYKVLAGLITTKRLMLIALGALAIYIVWICIALFFSFQRKFSVNCTKLYNYIRGNNLTPDNLKVIDFRIEKISNGFYYGWKKFKSSTNQKPSNFITRREALDVEVSGGVLNQGKTFMRTYIVFVTAILFIFNLAYLGSDSAITCFVIAETLVLPFMFYFVMKLFYFLYTSIKQQMYKQDVQCYYDLIALLDETFGSNEAVKVKTEAEPVVDEEGAVVTENGEVALEENEEDLAEPEKEVNPLDDYDIFKKKNIDVEKLMNEENGISGTTLPYINVDSDYVIKDEGHKSNKSVTENDNGSSVLGGMMQDMSSIKKSNNFIDVDKEVAEIDNDKVAEIKAQEQPETPKEEDPFSLFEKFAVNTESEPAPAVEELKEEVKEESKEEKKFEEIIENPIPEAKENSDELSESEEQQIATVVSNFKSKRSKLANGGVVIERNEPIARRERPAIQEEPEVIVPEPIEPIIDENSFYENPQPREVQQLDVADDADSVLNSLKTTTGGYESFQNFGGNAGVYQNPAYAQNYPGYNAGYVPPINQQNYNQFNTIQQNGYGMYQNPAYPQNNFNQMEQNNYAQDFNNYESEEEFEETMEEVKEPAKKKKVLSKEEEPRPRGLKKKEEKAMETVQVTKTRGRPKKAEVSETMTIKNDKEFDEVLARAEKLMRKSDEGLSQSQSKRIEKELKMLMDAMNRYKESK